MRCLEDICRQELIEEDTIELLAMDNSDIDMFMTNEEYDELNRPHYKDYIAIPDPMPSDVCQDVWADKHRQMTDDDNAACKYKKGCLPWDNEDKLMDDNSIISYYSGTSELDALTSNEINKEYDMLSGEEKYDG